ncbi:MAG: phosphate acyltransferase [Clostridiales bacterium]|nr:phosphate acyltransferase [Clostridiales bacterium]
MIGSLDALVRALSPKPVLAVAVAQDAHVLLALRNAADAGLCRPLLIGNEAAIFAAADAAGVALGDMEILPCEGDVECCRAAVRLVREGRAQAVMKGLCGTATILREVLHAETGLRESALLSYVSVFELPGFERLIFLTDPALNMYPDTDAKKHIIHNAVSVARAMGVALPVVACVCALETVNPKMPPTLDAAELVRLWQEREIQNCIVTGPLALDNCLYREAALHKGIEDENAGRADILLVPNIEAGNVLHKAFSMVLGAPGAGVLVGARAPVVITSRVDSEEFKLRSIALALHIAAERNA